MIAGGKIKQVTSMLNMICRRWIMHQQRISKLFHTLDICAGVPITWNELDEDVKEWMHRNSNSLNLLMLDGRLTRWSNGQCSLQRTEYSHLDNTEYGSRA